MESTNLTQDQQNLKVYIATHIDELLLEAAQIQLKHMTLLEKLGYTIVNRRDLYYSRAELLSM